MATPRSTGRMMKLGLLLKGLHVAPDAVFWKANARPEPGAGMSLRAEPSATPVSVLLVDDDGVLREALRDMLEEEGFRVVGNVGSAAEALSLAEGAQPDVAMVDYRMPDVNGIDLTLLLKERVPGVQIVMLTAHDEQSLCLDASRVGVFSFLAKGCAPWLIMETIRRAAEAPRMKPVSD
jgi:DNA-binding NarL/FixJ family response regulator